ncbi:MAG: tetratricopeptide repeat protein [Planctomycetota bacterium]
MGNRYGRRRHGTYRRCGPRVYTDRLDYGYPTYGWYDRPYRSNLVVVEPYPVYVDRPLDTVVETYVDQQVLGQPVIDYPSSELPASDPVGTGAFTVLPPGDTPSQADLLAPLERGDAAFTAGDYAEARRHYIRAQLDGPYAGEASLAYGLTRFAEGDYALAAMAFRRGLAAVPDAIDRPIDVLHFYGASGDPAAHLTALTDHLAERPDDAYGWFVLGYVRFGSGDAFGALDAFDRTIVLDPQEQLPYLLRDAAQAAFRSQPAPELSPPPPPAADPEPTRQGVSLQAVPPELL